MLYWIYGSGFPKSLDISKAIDRSKGENRERQLQFTAWMRSTGITAEQINEATGTSMASHYMTEKSQPAIATADLFDKLRPYLPEVPEYIERLVAERTGIEWTAYKNRAVIGKKEKAMAGWSMDGKTQFVDRDITAPATPEAEAWNGWGTALKPAHEPIIIARKPETGEQPLNIQLDAAIVYHGHNLDILPTLPDNSIDAIVTDPPYELGFMGKSWDASGIAYNVELWKECLRVLKPGGHLLSFGGSRTFHRIAVAIEDAGFEIRDNIAWLYGSGFPKSLDISKAIDKSKGENRERQLQFTAWMRSTGLTAAKANKILQESGAISGNGTMAGHYFDGTQPAIATADLFDKLRPHLPEVPEYIERLVAERTGIEWTAYKNRAVIGKKLSGIANPDEKNRHTIGASQAVEVDITAPATPEAEAWNGWGTALKPAFEPVIVARKPLIGTVAQNVLEFGTGGLNIDGSRIGSGTGEKKTVKYPDIRGNNFQQGNQAYSERESIEREITDKGRWPANLILDEYTAELLDEQSDASRFFYIAKASKADRNEGLEELPVKQTPFGGHGNNEPDGMTRQLVHAPRQNFHPTVKPTQLMRYLIRLVTPPGGVVLDPFTGSGSTGKAAILEGFDFIGIELTEEYLPIIEGRLRHAVKMRAEQEEKKDEMLF
jgi:DNA modification methylase